MRRTLFLLSLVLMALVFTGSSGVYSQDSDNPPPKVIDIWPLPGVELAPDEPLTISFNQAMDKATVEAAFRIQPELVGSLEWVDSRTVNFVPESLWERATEYTVMLDQSAKAENGLTLEESVLFTIKSVGALTVSEVIPAADAENVAADARILVTFNRPVVPLVSTDDLDDLPIPITIEPTVEGQGEWLNTGIYMFTPKDFLQGGTMYSITVSAGLTAVDGATLDSDYMWSFSTLPPQILSISPYADASEILLAEKVFVQFSQPMDKASTEAAFSLLYAGEAVAGELSWDEAATYMTFTPSENLQLDTTYLVNIGNSAKSANGEATLDRGYSQSFRTIPYPGVEGTWPENGDRDILPGSGAGIYFKSPMNAATLEGKIEITPEVEWEPYVYGDQTDYLGIGFTSLPNTSYTITLKSGTEDIYGNLIETDYTFGFTTGDIETWAYPITSYNTFLLTGAHREDTRIGMYVSGTPKINFRLYKIPSAEVANVAQEVLNYYYDETPRWVNNTNLVRSWTEEYDTEGISGVSKQVLLASEEGGTLETAFYWLVVQTPNRYSGNDIYQHALAVVNTNLVVKRSPTETLVWVTDMVAATPVQETTVTIYHKGQAIARGQTNADGVFRAPVDIDDYDEFIYIDVNGAGAYGVWYNYSAGDLPTEQNYLYTDRPIYRPGETVYFKGVLRDRMDMAYSVPNQRSVIVRASAVDGSEIFNQEVPVSDFGTFSGEFVLPENVAIGPSYLEADYLALNFTIADFRVPEYEVGVTAQQDEIFQGDELNAVANASYYFGGGVGNATLWWNASGIATSFNYTGPGRYSFYDETWDYFYSYHIADGSGTTDSSGQYVISTTNTRPYTPRPILITVEANVEDESFQVISGRTTILAHPANVYVGLRSDRYFGREGETMPIEMVAVTADSEPIADQKIDLTIVEIRWTRNPIEGQFGQYTWEQEEIEVEKVEIRTGSDGIASYQFTPPNAGIFRARAVAMDEYERTNSSTLRFWVTGSRPVWWGQPSQNIDLIANQDSYKVGDVAEILVPIPFAGHSTVLVSIERAGIMSYEVVEVEGSTLLYELPITADHIPTIHFSVMLIKGIDEESLNPDFRTGAISLSVEPTEQLLTITVTPSAARVQPGETLTFEVDVKDTNGNPVQAEVGLALTDKAILALLPANSGKIEDAFYGYQRNYVNTSISTSALLDRLTDQFVPIDMVETDEEAERSLGDVDDGLAPPMAAPNVNQSGQGGGGGGGPITVTVREDFQQTPLWEAHVVTNSDGHATVSLEMPDNLTTWTLDARALTVTTLVGQATTEVVTTLPLLVRPVTPRFFVVGDRVQLASVINNNTETEQTVEATLQATGVELESDTTQIVTIPSGERARVEWNVVVQDVEFVDLTFIAIGANGYQDATKPTLATGPDGTIPVYRYTAPDTVGTAGVLRDEGSRVEGISLPSRFADVEGDLIIRTDPSLAATTIETLDYLENFPHQCIEQTVSRFLPNIVTYRALLNLGISDPVLEAKLFTALNEALVRLVAEQNVDGGWGWFTGMESNPLVTAYAALGLIHARDAGFEIDQTMIDRALNFMRSDFVRPSINVSEWRLNRQAFYLYVLAQDGQAVKRDYDELFNVRLNMSYSARAYLLMAYHKAFPSDSAMADLISDLNTAALVSATGAHWEEENNDWWNWTSDTRTTALVLNALVLTDPQNELLPNAVRWLMVARNGDHWETTQENTWAIIALTDWMVLTGELQGNYTYNVNLNREGLAEDSVTPETVREGQELRISVQDLLKDEVNRLIFARGDGEGALYYTTHLDLDLPASEVSGISRGVIVERQYFLPSDAETPVTTANIGDTLNVRITFTLPEDVYYFVLEDPIPAGTEAVNTSLLTTSQQGKGPSVRPVGDEWFWYWGWWWFDRTELRDEMAVLYADFLPAGTYIYSYQIRASVPGEFQTMPSHGYAFYFPEVFGRTDGTLFTVLPQTTEN